MISNFDFLAKYWPELAHTGLLAEMYVHSDANACILKLGDLAEGAARVVCGMEGVELPREVSFADRLRKLNYADLLPKRVEDLFYTLRRARDDAAHLGMDSLERAADLLELTFHLSCWLMQVYGHREFIPPVYAVVEDRSQEGNFPQLLQQLEDETVPPVAEDTVIPEAETPREERAPLSHRVAEALPLSRALIECLGGEGIRVDMTVLPVINYAMQQNGAVAIQSVTVENNTDELLENVELRITSAPAFAMPFVRHIDRLPPRKTVTLSRPKLILNGEFLAGMTEKVTGVLHAVLRCDGKKLVSDNAETTVLAFDEWHGIRLYPELLAAFVTPNHPELARIIARATEFLGDWTGDTSMDGYQSQDPNRVLRQAAAIFTAIKEQAIAYVVPPASFERSGQRVRLCDTVLRQKLGTCLDLTLLYASCLEAVGLHPLLIVTEGHIFTGLWLEEQMFPETVQDDFSLITKRLASGVNEIAVVETTCVTTGADRSFDDARAAAEQNFIKQRYDCFIDVHRARMSRVCPLPQRVHTASGWVVEHDTSFQKENMSAPRQLDETIHIDPNAKESELPKKMQWERKLLDLGMRNNLINLRLTKNQLPILTRSLDELENALADGSDFAVLPKPADLSKGDLSFETLTEMGDAEIIKAEFDNKRLRSALTENELSKTVKELYRTARVALEENGANTLYLALGMLRWFENKRSTKARYAPVILVPIEMVRKSAAQGYVIRLRDDEPQMNITLLEKLKQDFGIQINGVDPLPMDEHGIDIRRVLTILRKAVMEQTHWDVLETATLGIFSFSQFVMWNDIRNRTDDLLRNKVVRSLMEGKLCWDAQPLEMGDRVNENDVLLPMPADASQLYAIQAACGDESFVLHGPPGTGKSQTITSLIANALAQGKSVLFVAEKMAALEVVQKRLNRIGIGPFCLELHSNKSKKRDVLEQLRQATEVTKTATAAEYAAKARQLAAMRAQLDGYAEQLHKLQPCGRDLHTLINEYERCKDAPDMAAFDRAFLQNLHSADMEHQQLTVERMITAAREVGHPHGHPLAEVGCTQYTQNLRANLQSGVEQYAARLRQLEVFVTRLTQALGEPLPDGEGALRRLSAIASHLGCWYDMPSAWAKTAFPQLYFEEVTKLAQHSMRANQLEQQLLQCFDRNFLTLDGQQLFTEYAQTAAQWFLPKMMGMNKLVKTLSVYARVPVNKENVGGYITVLRDCQQEGRAAGELLGKYGKDLGPFYQGKATDWGKLTQLAGAAQSSAQALYNLYGSYDVMHRCCGDPNLREAVFGLWSGIGQFNQAKSALDTLLGIRQRTAENWLAYQQEMCDRILANAHQLKEWIAYVGAAEEAKSLGLANVVACLEGGAEPDTLMGSYKKALLQGLIANAIDESGTLNQFSGAVFNKKIEQYQRMDEEWVKLSQQEVYCRLAAKVPNFTREAAQSSELGILQRCIKSGGRGTSIRKLFDQIPNLLPRLCPCMLMSPISAAQYLDPKREPFDIVVFDEASQLPTCKAVGVLARGKNAIIVGDPKQMPPTAFFATNTVDEDNLEIEDLESILDDCLALNMPQSHLLWHYRSRHESLIAFSNSQFYENKLFTFPSVNDRESKVRLVQVDGVFDRGKTRTNKAEALAVVEEIKRRAKDPVLREQSVGIVTFNISQQHLIDDLLTEAYAQDPELEKWAVGAEEPLFIKNLENVQGDERDVILFSVGFGPDENGKLYMNFGPLNRDGGWRRLNVAVSRSRCEMMVFSTLRAEQLDLSRTNAEGVAALRSFLEYAEGRPMALEETQSETQPTQTDGIARSICTALAESGFETDLSVGRSKYRIDIGVVDPEDPDRYILGILLDGDSYGDAKTTRDREVAQVGVLSGLGWSVLRVWTMDWWDNSEKELKRILKKLKELQKLAKERKTEPPQPEEAAPAEETAQPEQPAVPEEAPARLQTAASASAPALPQPEAPKTAPVYQAVSLPEASLTADTFLEPRNNRSITQRLEKVIKAEAPISLPLLTKRVVQSYGITRAGSRIQNHISELLQRVSYRTTTQDGTVFCWRKDQEPEAYAGLRVNGEEENRRDAKDVPVQEVANAIYVVLFEQVSMGQEDLLRETAKKLGYTRLGGNVLSALELGIEYAQSQGGITTGANGSFVLSAGGTARAEAILKGF